MGYPMGLRGAATRCGIWARGLTPTALCGYVRQADCRRRTVGTTTFAANHTAEQVRTELSRAR